MKLRCPQIRFIRPQVALASGFTLVELMVVLAAIAVLIAIVLPTAIAIRAQAKLTKCAANLRQIGIGLETYAAANEAHYPPNLNSPSPGRYWFDRDRAGQFLGDDLKTPLGTGGSILACPSDDGGERSYAMNIWASSAIDPYFLAVSPPPGTLWGPTSREPSALILATESWSYLGSANWGWYAQATLGYVGVTSGRRFGADGGIAPPTSAGRWGLVNSELPYMRHRLGYGRGKGVEPTGRINIAYADGHVALKSQNDLADFSTGLSSGDSLWFPGDARK